MEEVGTHNKAEDCWVVVSDKVFDITSLVRRHPGGSAAIIRSAGKDATQEFYRVFHSQKAKNDLKSMCIGVLDRVGSISCVVHVFAYSRGHSRAISLLS